MSIIAQLVGHHKYGKILFDGYLTFLCAFDGVFEASSTWQQIVWLYICMAPIGFVFITVVSYHTAVGGAKEQKIKSTIKIN